MVFSVICIVSLFVCLICTVVFFFFKQKTAYEISLGLVGSEMCIRDRTTRVSRKQVDLNNYIHT